MIFKEYGKYTLVCDICGASTDEDFDAFQDAVDAREGMGWKSRKIISEWTDICPDCSEIEEAKE